VSARGALAAALRDLYHQSWRLLLLNAGFSLVLVPLVVAALWTPLALLAAVLVAGPLAMAMMHCAVTLAETEDLHLGCALVGLRLHWRRGLVLGGLAGLFGAAGVVALVAYGRAQVWPLVAVVAYLLASLGVLQVVLWPLAVLEPASPLSRLLRRAAELLVRRPLAAIGLALALALVNAAGAAAALMPLLTLTIAYSSLAAAHFVLPASSRGEAGR
jgi:hypothetical protein